MTSSNSAYVAILLHDLGGFPGPSCPPIDELHPTIVATFDHSLDAEVVEKAIALMVHQGILRVSDAGRVTYCKNEGGTVAAT